eukprot:m.275611 g.275611  ORF g.275611 m.275611 type:complete len:53 (+) comp19356_c1_seq5:5199-5357(+)
MVVRNGPPLGRVPNTVPTPANTNASRQREDSGKQRHHHRRFMASAFGATAFW